jgi:endonuclease VIII
VPEGDTIAYAANRIRPVLEGFIPDEIATPQPRHALDRWPERLSGRAVRSVDTHGKHLFIRFGPLVVPSSAARSASGLAAGGATKESSSCQGRADRMSSGCFEGELVLHSHLGMTGVWGVYGRGRRWARSPRRAWIVLRRGERTVVEFDGPLLELVTEGRTRFDQRLAALGPDVLAAEFDGGRFLMRLRADDPTRPIGDALLDQRNVAGIGNLWKAEACWEAAVDPWRAVGAVSDAEAGLIIERVRPRMARSAAEGHRAIMPRIYGRAGRPCPRCGTPVVARGQGDANRTTYWCPGCQR